MAGIKIPVEAAFQSDGALKEFASELNQLGAKVAAVSKMKFQPVDKATLDTVKQLNAHIEKLSVVSPGVVRRAKLTGQENVPFHQWNWNAMYSDPAMRARKMAQTYAFVTQGQQFGLRAPDPLPGVPGSGGGGGGGTNKPRHEEHEQSTLMRNLKRIMGAGTSAAGAGGVISGAGRDAAGAGGLLSGAGAMAGVAGLIGGVVALGVGKLVGGVKDKIGAVQNEYMALADLKRNLGDVNVGFEHLRDSLRLATNGLGLTYEESVKLGTQYTKESGVFGPEGAKEAYDGVRLGAGYSRSLGLDPAAGVGLFANMRHFKATTSTEDNRRMGLLIGEGIAKSGTFSKAEDVLAAVEDFTAISARSALQAPNVAGYMGSLTSMMGAGVAGLDPKNSGNILSRADSNVSGGGNEAAQNYWFSLLGRGLGLNPMEAQLQREGGLFASQASTFGEGSLYAKLRGGKAMPGKLDTRTNLEMMMANLAASHPGDTMMQTYRLAGITGLSATHAQGLMLASKQHGGQTLGSLDERMKRLGIDQSKIDPTAFMKLAGIEADKSLTDEQKNEQVKQTATVNQLKTEGDKTRETIAGVSNAMSDAATLLLGPLNSIRAGVMHLAGNGQKSPQEIEEAMLKLEADDQLRTIGRQMDPKVAEAQQKHAVAKARLSSHQRMYPSQPGDTDGIKKWNERQTQLEAEVKASSEGLSRTLAERQVATSYVHDQHRYKVSQSRGDKPASDAFDKDFLTIGREEGVDPKILKAIGIVESGLNPLAVSPKNANGSSDHGMMQHNSKYIAERGLGNGKVYDPVASIRASAKLLKEYGYDKNPEEAVRRYNGQGPKAEAYRAKVLRTAEGVQLSPEAVAADRAQQIGGGRGMVNPPLAIEGTFHLYGQNGSPAAAPVNVKTQVGRTSPAGVN